MGTKQSGHSSVSIEPSPFRETSRNSALQLRQHGRFHLGRGIEYLGKRANPVARLFPHRGFRFEFINAVLDRGKPHPLRINI